MSRAEDGGPGLDQGPVRTKDVGPRSSGRPKPDQPLRARWDPTDDSGRPRVDRDAQPEYKKQSALGRFVSTYGWRAYAIPVLTILTIALIVVTIKDSGNADLAPTAAVNPDSAARNPYISTETRPIGAPTGDIQPAALPAGTLPQGGPFTTQGRQTFRVLRGAGEKVGTGGQEYTYTVEVENGLNPQDYGGDPTFAKMVDTTLTNPRSWIGDGRVSFRRIDRGEPDLRITLVSTGTTRELCGYQIKLETSCFYPPQGRVTLNEARWVRGALSYEGDDVAYRQYLVNHEVGHGLGYAAHEPCREDGALAPVMMQQSFGTANSEVMALDPDMKANRAFVCRPNPWPFPSR
ncbi:DUF3152 domain-containing protein [Gordonia amicalis]|uniref:DUF3152 domain-containing protein n=1 Tax=Gordonia amicalis TaxID=89053 RepID=A0ABU4DI36_9ACTN|nr:DUF3152 domain-containing protein [Gordonia amicalis]MCZ4580678.1 DUF3152 domain-containing protein [Gordonia amicalis]MCZ4653680.1 DUF3152 domain-containing protein [Gordonia amicalis]MDJ0451527.1 DUF3152 domain-containing protein [Gordonia amicalis]MDV6309404.1 DUF3152 domain-containing protein [Gordonia amicalis]MDV7075682.1 DUF3152 domain-containing protein [Gordonia amicalis]